MIVKNNGSTFLTRIYAGSKYMKETLSGVTKEYTYIGGDAYAASICYEIHYRQNRNLFPEKQEA